MKIIKEGDKSSHSIVNVEGDLYIEKRIHEEVMAVVEITQPTGYATVTHTGAYGRIKFTLDGKEYVSANPFSEYFGKLSDIRIGQGARKVVAERRVDGKIVEAIDLIAVKFNLSGSVMGNLHNKLYIGTNPKTYFIEIPKDYEQENV